MGELFVAAITLGQCFGLEIFAQDQVQVVCHLHPVDSENIPVVHHHLK
jgi:hypothetical protein